jgi:hypothetical protein
MSLHLVPGHFLIFHWEFIIKFFRKFFKSNRGTWIKFIIWLVDFKSNIKVLIFQCILSSAGIEIHWFRSEVSNLWAARFDSVIIPKLIEIFNYYTFLKGVYLHNRFILLLIIFFSKEVSLLYTRETQITYKLVLALRVAWWCEVIHKS